MAHPAAHKKGGALYRGAKRSKKGSKKVGRKKPAAIAKRKKVSAGKKVAKRRFK